MRDVSAIAVRLFDELGFDSVTMEEVANAADVSVATLYRRFMTKENLVCWQADEQSGMSALVAAVQSGQPIGSAARRLAQELSDDGVEAIEATAHTRLELIRRHAALRAAAREKADSFIASILEASASSDPRSILVRETETRCVAAALEAGSNAWLRGEGSLRECTIEALEVLGY